jgi:hypothetical protein
MHYHWYVFGNGEKNGDLTCPKHQVPQNSSLYSRFVRNIRKPHVMNSIPQTIEPKVLVVEEAGQVLEAHILATLVPSGTALKLAWHRRTPHAVYTQSSI